MSANQKPSIRVVKTIGGFFRVVLHGPDNLQEQRDRPRYCEMDIGRGDTRAEAIAEAVEWFADLERREPTI